MQALAKTLYRSLVAAPVVPETDGIAFDSGPGGIPALRIDSPSDPKAGLQDILSSGLWRHAQVTGGNLSGAALNRAPDRDPAATVSRLAASPV